MCAMRLSRGRVVLAAGSGLEVGGIGLEAAGIVGRGSLYTWSVRAFVTCWSGVGYLAAGHPEGILVEPFCSLCIPIY